jgi:hypothetical protein
MVRVTETMLAETFACDKAFIYLVDNDKKEIIRYTDEGEIKVFPMHAGLIGLAIEKRELLSITDAYNHHAYNGMIDIYTRMPVLVKPIMETTFMSIQEQQISGHDFKSGGLAGGSQGMELKENGGNVLACLEVINKLGVVGRSTRNKANMDPLDGEMLELFEK